jgi:Cupredoxin-like domain
MESARMNFANRSKEIFQPADRGAPSARMVRLMLLALLGTAFAAPAYADMPTFTIEFHDGKISPPRTEVPANQQFKIELRNTGATAAEFESHKLHKEQVLAPKSRSVLVFQPLKPGEYAYFDDFHPSSGPKPVLEAK